VRHGKDMKKDGEHSRKEEKKERGTKRAKRE
jgi:hypothetical protein